MALLTFPLNYNQFLKLTKTERRAYSLDDASEALEDGHGEIVTVSYGPRLWAGSFTSYALNMQCARPLRARLEMLKGAGASFMWRDPFYTGPADDPGGVKLGGANPQIDSIDATRRAMKISLLPSNYKISTGDLISWTYSTHFALYEVARTRTADASGIIQELEVTTPIVPGSHVGATLELLQPTCKARIVPGSVNMGSANRRWNSPFSFSWRQTLR